MLVSVVQILGIRVRPPGRPQGPGGGGNLSLLTSWNLGPEGAKERGDVNTLVCLRDAGSNLNMIERI